MDKKSNDKKAVERSASYPGVTLESAIGYAETLRKNLGSTAFSRESAAQALGHPSINGTSIKKTAACVHFGLLTRQGNTYRQSVLSDKYFNPTSEAERSEALVEAIQSPILYGKLLTELNGKSLPGMLENVLTRNYGITEKASAQAAKDFRSSAEFAGVLVNGVVNLSAQPASESNENETEQIIGGDISPAPLTHQQAQQSAAPFGANALPIKIPGTDVTIIFPVDYAYDLSVGTFSEGIKALEKNIKESAVYAQQSKDESDPSTEE